jgi:aerobic carbon-monoxide dehydrogenase medium subunit
MLVAQRSTHRIRPFRLHHPKTAEEAVKLHARSPGAAAYMGGGTDLMAALKAGACIEDVIHLGSLPDCTSIAESEEAISIGPGVTHQILADSRQVRAAHPSLCDVWSKVANNRVRIKATVAGNLMARNQSYDFPIVAIAVGAQLEFLDSELALRRLPAHRSAELPQHALLTRITLPRARWLAVAVQLQWKPITSFALSFRREHGAIMGCLAVGCGFGAVAFSKILLERCLFDNRRRETAVDITEQLCAPLPSPKSDWHASAEYRRHLLKVLVRREIERIRVAGPNHEG